VFGCVLSGQLRGLVLRGLEVKGAGVCSEVLCGGCFGCSGWVLSRARNKFLVWKSGLGRVTWFRTGTVLFHVRKPGSLGKAKQLFCDAFGGTGLVTDVKLLVTIADGIVEKRGLASLGLYQKGVHVPYLTNQRLPSLTINDFAVSHGITIKVGDRSHPNAVEVIAEFPAQTERLIAQTGELIRKLESKEAENVDLKSSLSKLMGVLNDALGKQTPSEPVKDNLVKLGGKSDYVT